MLVPRISHIWNWWLVPRRNCWKITHIMNWWLVHNFLDTQKVQLWEFFFIVELLTIVQLWECFFATELISFVFVLFEVVKLMSGIVFWSARYKEYYKYVDVNDSLWLMWMYPIFWNYVLQFSSVLKDSYIKTDVWNCVL